MKTYTVLQLLDEGRSALLHLHQPMLIHGEHLNLQVDTVMAHTTRAGDGTLPYGRTTIHATHADRVGNHRIDPAHSRIVDGTSDWRLAMQIQGYTEGPAP